MSERTKIFGSDGKIKTTRSSNGEWTNGRTTNPGIIFQEERRMGLR